MSGEANQEKVLRLLNDLGARVRSPGCIYLTGGTAVLHGWRETTIDLDLKAAPGPSDLFEAIAELKESINLKVELASTDDFIPETARMAESQPFGLCNMERSIVYTTTSRPRACHALLAV